MSAATSSAGFGNSGSRRRRSNANILAWDKNKQSDQSSEPRLERHSNALVSQTDLFLQCKVEGDDTTREGRSQLHRRVNPSQDDAYNPDCSRGRERKRGRESRSRHASPDSSKHYDMHDAWKQRSPRRIAKSQSYYVNTIICCFLELISRLTENISRSPEM